MNIRFTRESWVAFVGSAAIAFILAGPAYGSDENTVAKSFKVQPGGRLVVNTDLGSIEVRGAEANSVDITVSREVRRGNAEKTLAEFKLDFEQKGNDIFVTGDSGRRGWHWPWNDIGNRLRVRFVITVPKVYNLDLKTGGGSVDVAEIQGRVESRTSGGSIEISRAGGDVDAETSGGSIRANDVMGGLRAETSGGSVTAALSAQPKTRCELSTSGGGITIYLTENVGMDVDAHSSGGGISIRKLLSEGK